MEIDMDEWELLPTDHGFISLAHHERGKNCLLSSQPCYGVVEMNYFICPSPLSDEKNCPAAEDEPVTTKIDKEVKDICVAPPKKDPDAVLSQVFFKKQRDSDFADMKMESPKSDAALIPVVEKIEVPESDEIFMEEKGKGDPNLEIVKEKPCWEGFGFNIWRWRIAGIGAICSVGVAAAALCILILGSGKSQKQRHHQFGQKLQFQIYADEKGIKQAMQQASRLNQAMMGSKAHISFGGYYDGL